MAAKPISDSVMTRRPFLCQWKKEKCQRESLGVHKSSPQQMKCQNSVLSGLCKPFNNVLRRVCPLCGRVRKQRLGAACRSIDHTALWRLQQVPRQRALLQQLTPATSKTHRCTQALHLPTTQKSSNYTTVTVYLYSRSERQTERPCGY